MTSPALAPGGGGMTGAAGETRIVAGPAGHGIDLARARAVRDAD